jgi:hypothetical protein
MRALPLLAILLGACSEYEVLTDTREEAFSETFTVSGALSDIVFYGDTSYSMQPELYTMGDNIGQFIGRLDENQDDWQIIAVTGPDGCAQGGILTPETPDVRGAFTTGITTEPGEDDVDEWGLFNVFQAVMKTSPGRCNEGFLRDEALLHIIFLSDEDDNSPGWQLGGDYWRDYVDPILYLKGDPAMVRFSAVTGPVPNGCNGADPGFGYAEATVATGGELLSICDDWSADIEILANASISQALFPLAHAPLVDTLEVSVNDTPRESGWVYDEEAIGVRFTEDLPRGWDEVVIDYRAIVEFVVEE